MRIGEFIKKKILGWLGIEKLAESPNSERLTYINDDDQIRIEKIRANRVWYIGDGDEILNYYTNQDVFGFARNPNYNRNKRNYFWGISAAECNIKRVHSGVPKAIADTITNIVGYPKVTSAIPEYDALLQECFEENNFEFKLMQQARPLTLVEGYGAWKPIINSGVSRSPILEYSSAEDTEFAVKDGVVIGIIYKSYYKDKKDKDYVLMETRHLTTEGSAIEYDLFKLGRDNALIPADRESVPELSYLPSEPVVIPGYNKILGVPTRYFFDPLNPKGGKSIYDGKLDLFDDLDQSLSQRSRTCRVSTPVEYFDIDLLDRDRNGYPILPSKYNREYVAKNAAIDADGTASSQGIISTQPQLNFDQYTQEQMSLVDQILIGILSPATMGIDVSRKDNALAQREKEKVTIMTRSNIISQETRELVDLAEMMIMLKQYMSTGSIDLVDHQISVKYDEFANPSFENELQILGQAWGSGTISTGKYVELLWGDKMSEAEQEAEAEWLDSNKQADPFAMEGMTDGLEAEAQPSAGEVRESKEAANPFEE